MRSARLRLSAAATVAVCLLTRLSGARGADPCPSSWQPAFPYDPVLYPFTNNCGAFPAGSRCSEEISRSLAVELAPRSSVWIT